MSKEEEELDLDLDFGVALRFPNLSSLRMRIIAKCVSTQQPRLLEELHLALDGLNSGKALPKDFKQTRDFLQVLFLENFRECRYCLESEPKYTMWRIKEDFEMLRFKGGYKECFANVLCMAEKYVAKCQGLSQHPNLQFALKIIEMGKSRGTATQKRLKLDINNQIKEMTHSWDEVKLSCYLGLVDHRRWVGNSRKSVIAQKGITPECRLVLKARIPDYVELLSKWLSLEKKPPVVDEEQFLMFREIRKNDPEGKYKEFLKIGNNQELEERLLEFRDVNIFERHLDVHEALMEEFALTDDYAEVLLNFTNE